jgi:membrane protease YdiL (CAAX protease family)
MVDAAAIGAGVLVLAATWWLIGMRRVAFWPATSVAFAILGVAAILLRPPGAPGARSLALGIGSGLALYAATRLVVPFLLPVAPFAPSATEVYRRSEEIPVPAVWLLTLAIAVPGEELFWRGFALPELQDATSVVLGAFLAWFGYVAVNAFSRNLSIVIAAGVCGAWWTFLGSLEGVASPLASHLIWTGLMLAWPPAVDRAKVTA